MRFQAVRGMPDLLPEVLPRWQHIEAIFRQLTRCYGFSEIRLPILESTGLFKRGVGEVTDIVEKEMYIFEDRNGDSLALRPEGTAGCVRAALEHGLIHNQVQKFWYSGPMFRHERPQKGRYRQFHHLGLEVFGVETPLIDAELIGLTAQCFKQLRLLESVSLEINTLGTPEDRVSYRHQLIQYFTVYQEQLDDDSKRRLHTNPLRILDSKNPELQDIIAKAPRMSECMSEHSRARFEKVLALLNAGQIKYKVNHQLVRGLDYYSHTVFEWVTQTLGAQGTVCAGGRYDGLVEQLGGAPTPAIGCAIGVERVALMLEALGVACAFPEMPKCYLIFEESLESEVFRSVYQWRDRYSQCEFIVNLQGGNFKKQFQRAHKSGADYAVIWGVEAFNAGCVDIKSLREIEAPEPEQQSVSLAECEDFLKNLKINKIKLK